MTIAGRGRVLPVTLGDLGDSDLDRMFGWAYWYKTPKDARSLLAGADLWGFGQKGWQGVLGLSAQGDGSLAITPWTPAVSLKALGRREAHLSLLACAKAVAADQERLLTSRMRDMHGSDAAASVDLLKEAGFRRAGLRYSMVSDLSDPCTAGLIARQPECELALVWDAVDDPECLVDLALQCFQDSLDPIESDWTRREWEAWLRATRLGGRGRFLPATSETCSSEGQSAGFVLATDSAGALYLSDMGLLPRWRGRGIGRLMLHRLLAKGVSAGYRTSSLMVAAENVPALSVYRSFGYRPNAFVALGEWRPDTR